MPNDGTIEIESIEQACDILGQDEFDRLVCDAVGVDSIDSPGVYEAFKQGGCIMLDPFLDYRDEDALREHVIDLLSDAGRDLDWAKDFVVPDGAKGADLVSALAYRIDDDLRDQNADYAQERALGIAQDVVRKLEGLETAAGTLDASALMPACCVDMLRERYGLECEWCSPKTLRGMRMETSVLLGDAPNDDLDLAAQRHTFDAAHQFVEDCWLARRYPDDAAEPASPALDAEDLAHSSLGWLCETQGTTLPAVLERGDGEFADQGRFAKSLREEISEASAAVAGWPHVIVMATMSVPDYLRLLAASEGADEGAQIEIPVGEAQPLVGIYDPNDGCGGCFGIELERPLSIPSGLVHFPMVDWTTRRFGGEHGYYTVQDACGWVHEAWEHDLEVTVAAPKRQAALEPEDAARAAKAAALRTADGNKWHDSCHL